MNRIELRDVLDQVKNALDVLGEAHGFRYVIVVQSERETRHGEALFSTEARTLLRSNLQTHEGVKLLQNALARAPIPQS